jgi:multidrug efflux pump subunit AcrB
MDDGRIMVKVKLPTGAALAETEQALRQIEAKLIDDPLIESYFTLAGGKVVGLYTYEIANEGQIDIQLVPRHARDATTQAYIRRLRPLIAKVSVPGGQAMVIQAKVKGMRKLGEADIEELLLNGTQGGHLRLRDVAEVSQAVGPVEIAREDQIKAVTVRGDAAGASVGEALASLKEAMQVVSVPPGYQLAFGGQAQMMAEMNDTILMILAFALFFSFVVLAVQFNSLKLPAIILGCLPFCTAGMIYALYLMRIPVGATVLIRLLVVVAAMVNGGVLLLVLAEELRVREGLTPSAFALRVVHPRAHPGAGYRAGMPGRRFGGGPVFRIPGIFAANHRTGATVDRRDRSFGSGRFRGAGSTVRP